MAELDQAFGQYCLSVPETHTTNSKNALPKYIFQCTKCNSTKVGAFTNDGGSMQQCLSCNAIYKAKIADVSKTCGTQTTTLPKYVFQCINCNSTDVCAISYDGGSMQKCRACNTVYNARPTTNSRNVPIFPLTENLPSKSRPGWRSIRTPEPQCRSCGVRKSEHLLYHPFVPREFSELLDT